ncbi:MAG: serine hydrolase [Bacteroidota bacterium]
MMNQHIVVKKLLISIICLFTLFTCNPNMVPTSKYAEATKSMETLLDTSGLKEIFHGTILIADRENALLEEAFGTDPSGEKGNQTDTKYDLASMPKMFTAASILQLREVQKLKLDQTIGTFLPDFPNEQAKNMVTIHHLLTHTSGLGDFFGPEFAEKEASMHGLEDYLPFFASDPLEFSPGERMRYSNGGFVVLGLILEKVTGQKFNDYFSEKIFKPVGMSSTGPITSSAGGGKSTARDLHKFAMALQNNQVISAASLTLMKTDHFGFGYGYGMSLRDLNGTKVYGHNGGAPGVAGELDMVENESLILVTLSNRSPIDGWAQVRTHLRKTFFGSTPAIEEFLNTEQVIKVYQAEGFEAASKKLAALNNQISDRNTFRFAEQYAGDGELEKAIDIIRLIVQAYPDQWHPYSFLADFQLQAGYKTEAIENYKKSLTIDSNNQHVIEQLKQLGEVIGQN